MQWLRHTRADPPTIGEQQADLIRQEQIKMLAAQADARWASKPSALDGPDKQQPVHMLESRDGSSGLQQPSTVSEEPQEVTEPAVSSRGTDTAPSTSLKKKKKAPKAEPKDSPWAQAQRGNPGDAWQDRKSTRLNSSHWE